jgi:histidinol-phosphate aminotransferase
MIEPRADLALMEGYHSPQVEVAVRLNTNESPLAPPAEWVDRVAALPRTVEWHRYPDRHATELRSRLADLHDVDPARVFVANGSNEVLQSLLLAYGGAGRSVAVFEPTYALHSHIARITGTGVVEGERDASLALDLGVATELVRREAPSVTFLCSPNNPTGMLEPAEAVATLAPVCAGLLVVDEAYGQFAPRSTLDGSAGVENLVVTRTFSKTWSMAAARLGYCVAPPEVVAELDKVVLPYHLDSFKQAAAVIALDYIDEMERRVATIVEERGRVAAALGELATTVWPSAANFVLFRPEGRDGSDVWRRLVERSVLVRDCSSWPRLEGCLRVTIGSRDENDTFLTALTEVLR